VGRESGANTGGRKKPGGPRRHLRKLAVQEGKGSKKASSTMLKEERGPQDEKDTLGKQSANKKGSKRKRMGRRGSNGVTKGGAKAPTLLSGRRRN